MVNSTHEIEANIKLALNYLRTVSLGLVAGLPQVSQHKEGVGLLEIIFYYNRDTKEYWSLDTEILHYGGHSIVTLEYSDYTSLPLSAGPQDSSMYK